MTGSGACTQIRLELGVYVLGAIEAADRSAVDAHLACCADCRDELAKLVGLPRLLSRAFPDDADGLVLYGDRGCGSRPKPSADLGPRCTLDRAARLRWHRKRPEIAGAGGACPIAGVGAVSMCDRYRAVTRRSCRAITGNQGGESAR
jgi:anti-sigma factor RsiW